MSTPAPPVPSEIAKFLEVEKSIVDRSAELIKIPVMSGKKDEALINEMEGRKTNRDALIKEIRTAIDEIDKKMKNVNYSELAEFQNIKSRYQSKITELDSVGSVEFGILTQLKGMQTLSSGIAAGALPPLTKTPAATPTPASTVTPAVTAAPTATATGTTATITATAATPLQTSPPAAATVTTAAKIAITPKEEIDTLLGVARDIGTEYNTLINKPLDVGTKTKDALSAEVKARNAERDNLKTRINSELIKIDKIKKNDPGSYNTHLSAIYANLISQGKELVAKNIQELKVATSFATVATATATAVTATQVEPPPLSPTAKGSPATPPPPLTPTPTTNINTAVSPVATATTATVAPTATVVTPTPGSSILPPLPPLTGTTVGTIPPIPPAPSLPPINLSPLPSLTTPTVTPPVTPTVTPPPTASSSSSSTATSTPPVASGSIVLTPISPSLPLTPKPPTTPPPTPSSTPPSLTPILPSTTSLAQLVSRGQKASASLVSRKESGTSVTDTGAANTKENVDTEETAAARNARWEVRASEIENILLDGTKKQREAYFKSLEEDISLLEVDNSELRGPDAAARSFKRYHNVAKDLQEEVEELRQKNLEEGETSDDPVDNLSEEADKLAAISNRLLAMEKLIEFRRTVDEDFLKARKDLTDYQKACGGDPKNTFIDFEPEKEKLNNRIEGLKVIDDQVKALKDFVLRSSNEDWDDPNKMKELDELLAATREDLKDNPYNNKNFEAGIKARNPNVEPLTIKDRYHNQDKKPEEPYLITHPMALQLRKKQSYSSVCEAEGACASIGEFNDKVEAAIKRTNKAFSGSSMFDKSMDIQKRGSEKDLYKDVSYKHDKAKGILEINIPGEGTITHRFDPQARKAIIAANPATDKNLLRMLDSASGYNPLILRVPTVKGPDGKSVPIKAEDIQQADLDNLLRTAAAAKLRGNVPPVALHPQYKDMMKKPEFQAKFPNFQEQWDRLQKFEVPRWNLGRLITGGKDVTSVTKDTEFTLKNLVDYATGVDKKLGQGGEGIAAGVELPAAERETPSDSSSPKSTTLTDIDEPDDDDHTPGMP